MNFVVSFFICSASIGGAFATFSFFKKTIQLFSVSSIYSSEDSAVLFFIHVSCQPFGIEVALFIGSNKLL